MLYQEAVKTVQVTERKISVLQEKVSLASRELSVLGRRLVAAREVLAVLEKEGTA